MRQISKSSCQPTPHERLQYYQNKLEASSNEHNARVIQGVLLQRKLLMSDPNRVSVREALARNSIHMGVAR